MLIKIIIRIGGVNMNPGFVVAMGISTVFIGLVAIIFVIMIMGAVVRGLVKSEPEKTGAPVAAPAVNNAVIADRDKVVVAISAAIAEEIGEDAGAIRIVSLKKV